MITKGQITPYKTYKNEKNLIAEVNKVLSKMDHQNMNIRYFITWTKEGRCFPIFIGQDSVQAGIHFYYNVVG